MAAERGHERFKLGEMSVDRTRRAVLNVEPGGRDPVELRPVGKSAMKEDGIESRPAQAAQ